MIRVKRLGRRTPLSVLDYLCSQQYSIGSQYIDLAEEFKHVLNDDFNFSEFWDVLQEPPTSKTGHHPQGTYINTHLESWENHVMNFHVREKRVLDVFSDEEYSILQGEFDSIKELVYQAALKRESSRLNCEVSELPSNVQVPFEEVELTEESPLVNLPNDLFFNVLRRLDTFDVFQLTLVSKKWKRLIEENGEQLTRVEHPITSHMVRFNKWKETSIHIRHLKFKREYDRFSWCLVQWTCQIARNLRTLILDQDVFPLDLASILQSCPKLKILQLGRTLYHQKPLKYDQSEAQIPMEVQLPQLEFLLSYSRSDIYTSKLTKDLVISSKSLQLLKGAITSQDWFKLNIRRPIEDIFRNLIALDLDQYPLQALETLSNKRDSKLKYLRLGRVSIYEMEEQVIKTAELFDQLMQKLSQLEVLIAVGVPGFNSHSIQVLTQQNMKLKFGIFVFQKQIYSSSLFDDPLDQEVDASDVEVIINFRDMLQSHDPKIDLTQFHFYLEQEGSRRKLEEEEIGFSFLHSNWIATNPVYLESQLNHPKMKKRLNIEF